MAKTKARLRAKQVLQNEKDAEEQKLSRKSNTTYELLDSSFEITKYKPIQYASAYFIRLEELRPVISETAAIKWRKCNIQKEIVNVKPNTGEWVIIGTLFKEMKLKPSVCLDLVTILGKKAESYIDDEDTMIIEDQSGRVKLLKNDIMNPNKFVTGVIVAIKGIMTSNGFFEANDFTYPGKRNIKIPKEYKHLKNIEEDTPVKPLYEDLENKEFVAFISGIQFGNISLSKDITKLIRWLVGQDGLAKDRLLSSKISRVVIGGNWIGEEMNINEVIKGSFRTVEINDEVYTNLTNAILDFESFLVKLSEVCEVDIMPGENDVTGAFLPQPRLNVALFPSLLQNDNVVFSTNPHMFALNKLTFLGSSGQNIEDIWRFKSMEGLTEVDILEETLEMNHLAPTCPDTLRSYPFESEDPMIIKQSPNVYFSCNSKEFGTKLIKQLDGGTCRLFTVPSFGTNQSIVLLDLETLDAYHYKFGKSKARVEE